MMETAGEPSKAEFSARINELERKLKEKSSEAQACAEKGKTASLFEFSEKGLRLKLYRFLLKKYSDLLNEKEKKTIGEVKALIDGSDLTIQSIVSEFKSDSYEFDKDYLDAAKKAFDFVKKEISYVKADLDIDFFMSPLEVMTEKIADDEDKAIFLCSMLYGLGDESASVVIAEMDDLTTHGFVVLEYDEKAYFLDSTQNHDFGEFSGKTEVVLKKYSFSGHKIRKLLYKFNHFEYKSFIEEE
ncbi:MAG: hypothetical protein NT067_06085 [Candidatus Diapherotrites archaeon]|nr:hypothetical protein [Candidatus Diapherotrites archaeon]